MMGKEETVYDIFCDVCEVSSEVIVDELEQQPEFCPMCGTPVEIQ